MSKSATAGGPSQIRAQEHPLDLATRSSVMTLMSCSCGLVGEGARLQGLSEEV